MKDINDSENDKEEITKNIPASGWMFPGTEHKFAMLYGPLAKRLK